LPWATIADLNDGILATTREGITNLAVEETRMVPVAPGTLLYSFKLTIGKMAVTSSPLYTNEAIAALVPREPATLDSRFLRYALASIDGGAKATTAVKGRTLNLESLGKIPVPVVPRDRQMQIVADLDTRLAQFELARAAVRSEQEAIEALPAALLRRAFSGLGA
jgi:type I restriction enzyme S subunit